VKDSEVIVSQVRKCAELEKLAIKDSWFAILSNVKEESGDFYESIREAISNCCLETLRAMSSSISVPFTEKLYLNMTNYESSKNII
jgi:hypothetical protein